MQQLTETTKEILARLVRFESLSGESNLDLIRYVSDYLEDHGVTPMISTDETGQKANLFATIGPDVDGGVLFNGHSDVVPARGQDWSRDPFILHEEDGRLYGRGSVDMKGFLACMLAMVPAFKAANLEYPIQISICYDEEIGGFGAPILARDIIKRAPKPAVAIVGEPTTMLLVSGHKGGYEMHTEFTGHSVHASDPRKGVNAIEFASRYINKIIEIADRCQISPELGSPFEPPYTTFNVGRIEGGVARNVTANNCALDWEMRPIPGEDGRAILAELQYFCDSELLPLMRTVFEDAEIRTTIEADVPGLRTEESSSAVQFIRQVTGLNSSEVVSFGTDAGHFDRVGISTVVFGPGSIAQAHMADEFIAVSEITNCLEFMHNVAEHLSRAE